MPQNTLRPLGHDLRAGLDAVDHQRADHQRHHGIARNAERQHRDERGLRARIVGGFRSGDALDRAVAELRRDRATPSSPAHRRRTTPSVAPPPGSTPSDRAEAGAAQHRRPGTAEVVAGRPEPRDLLRHQRTLFVRLRQVGDDLADAEHARSRASRRRCPSVNSVMPNVKRAPPVLPSVPISPISRPRMIMATALITEPCASTTAAIRPSTIREKYSGAPNECPTCASGGANSRDQSRSQRCRRRTSRAPRPPAPRRRGPAAPSGGRRCR